MTSLRFALWLLLPLLACAQHATNPPAFDAAANDARRLQLAPGLKLSVWATEPQLSNSVAFSFDGQGRVFLAESDRWAISVFDITAHTNWLRHDLSFRTVADRAAFLSRQFATNLTYLTKDSELVRVLEDRAGTGRADHNEIIASGFNSVVDGTAAGVLATGTNLYFANIPNLWRFQFSVFGFQPTNPPPVARPPVPTENRKLKTENLLASGFGVHIGVSGHDLHGLIKGPDGRIYMSFGDRGCVLTNREGIVINLPDTGGVLRCEPDGRDLELFCFGLRNPQELAFDDLGNLWTVDNDTAGPDPCRVLHLVEGGDYGWRTSYQHMEGFGPWVQEELWKGGQDGILPPAGTVSQGPSGLAYYPGTGFGDRLKGKFLHCDFPGGVVAFSVKPRGASYEVDTKERFLWNCWPTDVDFGPDGAAYVLDWVNGWGQPGKGRIYRITPNDVAADVRRLTSNSDSDGASSRRLLREAELVAQVKQLLAEGMTQRGEKELLDLLGHADRRVRLEAQWELAGRGPSVFPGLRRVAFSDRPTLSRLHAIWAVGQIARAIQPGTPERRGGDMSDELFGMIRLLDDADDQVRAKAARMLGNVGLINASLPLTLMADDPSSAVVFEATMAMGTIMISSGRGHYTSAQKIAAMLEEKLPRLGRIVSQKIPQGLQFHTGAHPVLGALTNHPTSDPFLSYARLRQWTLQEIAEANWPSFNGISGNLRIWSSHPSEDVRLTVLGTLRRGTNAFLTNFLADPAPRLVIAAGRAIHDVPIVEGFPALASFITKIDCPTNLLSRVIDACYRLGTPPHAQMLAGFAAREDVPDWARVLALRALADWEKPSPLDRVNGLWRPLVTGERPPSPRPSPPGRGGNVVSPSGNEPDQPTAQSSSSPDNPSLATPPTLTDSSTRPDASPSPEGEGRGEGGSSSRSAVPPNPLLERAAQSQAARKLGRAAELPVLPADLGRSVSYDEAMALRRNPAPAQRAFLRVAGGLMNPFGLNEAGQPAGTREVLPLQIAVAEAAAKLRVKEAGTPLFEKFARVDTAPKLRLAILPALAALRSPLTGDAVKLALADKNPELRTAALPHLDRLEGGDAVTILAGLVSGSTTELRLAQAAFAALAKIPGPQADAVLREAWQRLLDGKLRPELELDVMSAASPRAALQDLVKRRLNPLLPGSPALELLHDRLVGGDAERGRQIFFGNPTVQCSRCHSVGGTGGTVGPKLDGVGGRNARPYLLESIVAPNAKIAPGFETAVVTLTDGRTLAGAVKRDTDNSLGLEIADGEAGTTNSLALAKSQISRRERGPSAMPEGLVAQLTAFELRDLVAYLASLK